MLKISDMRKKNYIIIVAAWIGCLAGLQPPVYGAEARKQNTVTAVTPPAKPQTPKHVLTNSIGMSFVYVPPGTFTMGSPEDESGRYDRESQHEVKLTRGFYIQTTEVTQKQWEAVMKRNPSHFKDCGEDCPVEQVSWNDVQKFIWKLNMLEGMNRYKLPTEAEWEYACRAGTRTRFNWGNEPDCSLANFGVAFFHKECKSINPGKTMKVGFFPPNKWGLYDMHGNVWEWCIDRFDTYLPGPVTDPMGAYARVDRVFRGGSWSVSSRYCRSANRDSGSPNARLSTLGFRLMREP
ncbi:MAG: hypothetical protein B6245_00415 [Desulfobacteraceae bacterium 4572_88]|nr:MAG: hypothetical protein B6245_00415 [Desulfobacteraceae bacterium 4572_88]